MTRSVLAAALFLSGLSSAFAAGTTPPPAAATAAPAPLTKAAHDDALAFVQLVIGSKAPEIARNVTNGFMANLQQQHPDMKNETYEAVRQKVAALANDPKTIQSLEESLVSLFARYYSDEELRQVVAFGKTPAGAKLFGGTPPPAEVTAALRNWAQGSLAPQLNQAAQSVLGTGGTTPGG